MRLLRPIGQAQVEHLAHEAFLDDDLLFFRFRAVDGFGLGTRKEEKHHGRVGYTATEVTTMLSLLSVLAVAAAPAWRDIDVVALKSDLAAKKVDVLLDVRTPEEYAGGHVPGARNIPVGELEARIVELDTYKGKTIFVICQSGARSARASELLVTRGWSAVNVVGGTGAWIAAGYPTE